MIADLKPYPAMKDSGVPWLGEVPRHWDVRRIRNVVEMRVSNVDKHTSDDEEPVRLCNYIDVYKHDRIRHEMPFMRATASHEEITRFRLQCGDVLITKDSEMWNDIGVPALVEQSADDLICGYHLAILRPLGDRVLGEYLFRSLQSTGVTYQFHLEANGVTRYGLSHSAIKSIWLPLPPLSEQAAIVRFLDHADRRIRRYIRAKQKLIKLLEEQKQAIIHRAVTRGLDPNVRLKPSGVEWLGDVPEHWEVAQVRSIAQVVRGSTPRPAGSPVYFHGNAEPWITVGELTKDHEPYLRSTATRLTAMGVERSRIVLPGTLLLTNSGATLGVPKITEIHGCINDGVAAFLRMRPHVVKEFLYFYWTTQTLHLRAWVNLGAQPNLNTQIIGGWPVVVPPPSEQQAIANWISSQTLNISRSVGSLQKGIVLLREYRTRLIADVVTGKLDVREAVANLPEEAPEPEISAAAEELEESPIGEEIEPNEVLDTEEAPATAGE